MDGAPFLRGGRGEEQPPKRISKEVREARKALRDGDAKSAMTDHATTAMAFNTNRERLRAERLAREAVEPSPPPKKKKAGLMKK
jgi:transcription elongation GreA/GreB family factor